MSAFVAHRTVIAVGVVFWGVIGFAIGLGSPVHGEELSIYQVQYTTDSDGASPYVGQVIDCAGGVCVAKFPGYRPRLFLQDPAHADAWGAIQVKDWISPFAMFDDVEIGDWVSMTNMLVEEFRGSTILQRQTVYNPGYAIISSGNPIPPFVEVDVSEMPAPEPYPGDEWYVAHHNAERLESMRLLIRDVTVTAMDLGKANDNYVLQSPSGDACWAADYMNVDVGVWGYHPFVETGRHFCAVRGIFEQYTLLGDGWDYYQLITLDTAGLMICGDFDHDGSVDLADVPGFVSAIMGEGGDSAPAADVNGDGAEDGCDIEAFLEVLLSAR